MERRGCLRQIPVIGPIVDLISGGPEKRKAMAVWQRELDQHNPSKNPELLDKIIIGFMEEPGVIKKSSDVFGEHDR